MFGRQIRCFPDTVSVSYTHLDVYKRQSSNNRDTIEPYLIGKGGGSTYGGEIKPSKPEDERFWGEPGETKYTYTAKGELIETLIGPDGKAKAVQQRG